VLWFAVHLPCLSLEAFGAGLDATARRRPVALLAEHRIAAADAAAAQAGVQPGLRRATALALAPDLLLGQADAARDRSALQAVVHAALTLTPAVAVQGHAVLLEVQASLRFFGGPATLLSRLRDTLAPLGHKVQIASAATAQGAALLAQWRGDLALGPHSTQPAALQALLDELPLGLLAAAREHAEALQGMGLHRLGDLHRLPRSGLARRFGKALLDEADRARGTRPDPRTWLAAPERFEDRLELPMRADRAEQVLHGAAVLLARLVAWARARQARVAAFVLALRHEVRHRGGEATPAETTLRIDLAEPSADAAHLQLLLRERLARLRLAAPTLELRLECSDSVVATTASGELFPDHRSAHTGLVRLVEQLRARLGDEQVRQLQPVADHRPERACTSVAVSARSLAMPATTVAPSDAVAAVATEVAGFASAWPQTRPVWLLPEPLPLAERGVMPLLDGRALLLLSGPERIETGWWDGGLVVRDYFVAQAADGSLVWVFRQRLPGSAELSQPIWFLQGRFA